MKKLVERDEPGWGQKASQWWKEDLKPSLPHSLALCSKEGSTWVKYRGVLKQGLWPKGSGSGRRGKRLEAAEWISDIAITWTFETSQD